MKLSGIELKVSFSHGWDSNTLNAVLTSQEDMLLLIVKEVSRLWEPTSIPFKK